MPIGNQDSRPACLDYSFGSAGFISDSYIEWEGVPADHCLLVNICTPLFRVPLRRKPTWSPVEEQRALEYMSSVCLENTINVRALIDRVSNVQSLCEDHRTSIQKRRDRMPEDLRTLYRKVSCSTDREEAERLRKCTWARRREWVSGLKVESMVRAAARGKVFCKAKKLHRIKRLYRSDAGSSISDDWLADIAYFYNRKWQVQNMQLKQLLSDFVCRSQFCAIDVSVQQVADGFKKLRAKSKLDCNGICTKSLELLFLSQPLQFSSWLSHLAGSTHEMSELSLEAHILGKESSSTRVDDTRVIMPLCSMLGLLDVVLSNLIAPTIHTIFELPQGDRIGALPRTQPLDISHGLSAVIEKALDRESEGAVG